MPRGDGTGPTGMGPKTGRGFGSCANRPTGGAMDSTGAFLGGFGRWASGALSRAGRGQGRGQRTGRGQGSRQR